MLEPCIYHYGFAFTNPFCWRFLSSCFQLSLQNPAQEQKQRNNERDPEEPAPHRAATFAAARWIADRHRRASGLIDHQTWARAGSRVPRDGHRVGTIAVIAYGSCHNRSRCPTNRESAGQSRTHVIAIAIARN